MKKLLNLLLVGLLMFAATQALANGVIEPGDLGSYECRQVQLEAQDAVSAGMPYDNHGGMVSTAAKVVSGYAFRLVDPITCACGSCIVHQFAHGTPIAEQEPCGTDSPNSECEPATCSNFIPCDDPGSCSGPVCAATTEGLGVCFEGTTSCGELLDCTTSADCPAGGYCAVDSCCGRNVCMIEANQCSQISGVEATAGEATSALGCGESEGPTFMSP